MRRHLALRVLFATTVPLLGACGANVQRAAKTTPLPAPPVSAVSLPPAVASLPQIPVEDSVMALISQSDKHFQAGQSALADGHVTSAKVEFNKAIGVLLESPYGGRTEPRPTAVIPLEHDRACSRSRSAR